MIRHGVTLVALLGLSAAAEAQSADAPMLRFSIASQPMEQAFEEFFEQSGVAVTFEPHAPREASPRLYGMFTAEQAVARLLAQSQFRYQFVNAKTVAICLPRACRPPAKPGAGADLEIAPSSAVPEVLIEGTRTLNVDLPRTQDGAQPYVVFERERIARSQAANLPDFLATHLTMNTAALLPGPGKGVPGYASPPDIGGLGSHQTLILINGRRSTGFFTGGRVTQPDLSGIPLSAIERIEVLPGTASGIHGGSAIGGVINIVLRSDFNGRNLTADVERMAHSDVNAMRAFGSLGFQSASGGTALTIHAGYAEQDSVLMRDMPFLDDARLRAVRSRLASELDRFPPLGAQTNIQSASGVGLFGPGTPSIASVPAGHAGGGRDAFLHRAGAYNLELADTAQTLGARASVLHGTTLRTITLTARQEVSSNSSLYADVAYSQTHARLSASHLDSLSLRGVRIAADAPNNPFEQELLVSVPSLAASGTISDETALYRATLGTILTLKGGWAATFEFVRTGSQLRLERPLADPALLDDIATGKVDVLRDTSLLNDLEPYAIQLRTSPLRAESETFSLRLAGPALTLPGGKLTMTALVERREEKMGDGTGREFLNSGFDTPFTVQSVLTEQFQVVDSALLGFHIPIVSPMNGITGMRAFELEATVRSDDYRTLAAPLRAAPEAFAEIAYARSGFRSTNPVFGLRFSPFEALLLRASYATGFLPPAVSQLTEPTVRLFPAGAFIDWQRGNEPSPPLTVRAGGNPDLEPEHSRSWSAGLVLTPHSLNGFRLSIDYIHIVKRENIVTPEIPFTDLEQFERDFQTRVTRAPVSAGDAFGAGLITHIDATTLNLAESEIATWIFELNKSFRVPGVGVAELTTSATAQPTFSSRAQPSAPLRNDAGVTAESPLPWRVNASLDIRGGNWTVGWTARYYSAYEVSRDPRILALQGSARVDDRIYHDVFARFRLRPRASRPPDVNLTLGVRNLFNEAPAFDAGAIDTGFISPFADPRPSTYFVSISTGA
jgi:iron complex outermembrane recepter protein